MDYKVNKEAVDKIIERVLDNGSTVINKNDLEEMFPELTESEDERIRKELLVLVKQRPAGFPNYKKYIAWLEKQGVQKPAAWSEEDKEQLDFCCAAIEMSDFSNIDYRTQAVSWLNLLKDRVQQQPRQEWSEYDKMMFASIMNVPGLDEQQKEWLVTCSPQLKQEWSEEDELHIKELESLVKRVWAIGEHENDKDTIHQMSDLSFFLKTLKPQPKQEWSEEDEKFLSDIIKDLVHPWNEYIPDRIEDEIKWLKNRLKSLRPQNTWKPSDEQIKAVKEAACYSSVFSEKTIDNLISLSKQLKKLREE